VRVALARIGVLIVLCSAASAEDRPTGVHGFAKRMFAGIGAEERACRPEVMREIEARDMTALRWDIELHQKEAARAEPDSEPIVQPLTDWESNGSRHERIYRVEQKAVGVRFEGGGELLLVW
jgi:hypothetical protein